MLTTTAKIHGTEFKLHLVTYCSECTPYSSPSQKHFLKTICGPYSSYSSWLIHAELKVRRLASTAPPLHTEKSLSLGLMTRTLSPMSGGTSPLISAWSRSGSPENRVFPPSARHFFIFKLIKTWPNQNQSIKHCKLCWIYCDTWNAPRSPRIP